MPTYLENYSLARQIAQLKYFVTSSNDIINRAKLYCLFPEDIVLAESKYGKSQVDSFLLHRRLDKNISEEIKQTAHATELNAGIAERLIVETLLGIGECQALSFRVAFELLKRNRRDFSMVHIKNNLFPENHGKDHVIIILGDDKQVLTSKKDLASSLQALPDECIVIDLLLNHVGSAKTLLKDQADYYNCYQLNTILNVKKYSNMTQADVEMVEKNVTMLIQSMCVAPYHSVDFKRRERSSLLFHLPSSLQPINLVSEDDKSEQEEPCRRGILNTVKPFFKNMTTPEASHETFLKPSLSYVD